MDLIPGLPGDMGLECLIRVPYHYFSSLSSVCKSWKLEIGLPEFRRRRKASGLTRRVVVMAQARVGPKGETGSVKFPVYRLTVCEPETGYWAELPPPPGYSDGLPMFCQLVGIGSALVVLGGLSPATWEASSGVLIYEFVSATWRRGPPMPGPRRLFFACASDSDRTVFVAGGHDSEKCALRSALAYDVARDEWVHMPDMAAERDEPKGIYRRGEFHVVGGFPTGAQGRFVPSAEAFDAAAWRWGPVLEDFLGAAACPRNCVGVDGEGDALVMVRGDEVAVRDGSAWRGAAEVSDEARNAAYVAAWEGKVVVIGSERFGAPYKAAVLDLERRRWEKVEAGDEFAGHVQSGCCLEL